MFPLSEILFLLFVIVSQNLFSALCHQKKKQTISFALHWLMKLKLFVVISD